jgi:endonuclease G
MGIQPVSHDDYTNSGYNRGHLAPAEDFSKSQEAIDSTFIMSNVIPQKGIVNSGAWAQLEKKVRSWACGEKVITVITGPVLTSDLSKLKNSDISVPNEFYKIILDETPPLKLIAFKYNQFEKNQNIIKNKVSFTDVQTQDKLNLSTVKDSEVNDWKTCP